MNDGENISATATYTISSINIYASDVSYGNTTVQDAIDDILSKIK